MGPASTATAEREGRVLLLVPTRKDADVSQRVLAKAGLPTFVCSSISHLIAEIKDGAAAVLSTDELIAGSRADELVRVLSQQEEWSDLPIVLLIRGGVQSARATDILRRLANVTILERPTAMRSVVSVVQAAVRSRQRQYQTRSHIEQIREAEANARRADRAKDEFLAALSHELRTPLTPVLLAASEAAENGSLSAETRETFESIAKNVALEARLIDDLLDLTRITQGKLKLEKAPHDVIRILADAIANVEAEFTAKKLQLVTVLELSSCIVECDPTRLQQVFWNVLRNAAKFTPRGGRVTVSAAPAGCAGRVCIRVEDTGIGMSAEELARAFEAFVQGDHARPGTAHQFGGLGLGLAISRTLVELHHGSIAAESAGLGSGSAFVIELPVLAPSVPGQPRSGALGSRKSNGANPATALSILLVEDHESTRVALKRLLTVRGHHVALASQVAEACEVAKERAFNLLISDIGLPDGSGYDLLDQLKGRGTFLAVALTGYGMEDDVQRSREAGFFAHLTKPLRAADLDAVLNAVAAELGRR